MTNGSGVTFTTNANVSRVDVQIVFYAQNNVKFYPMIRLASITNGTYEPYTNGASPNPTYPQDINVATGTQEVVVENKNILKFTQTKTATSGGLTATCNDNTTITINGTSNGMVAMAFELDTKLLNGTYKLSGYTRNDTYLQLYTKNSSGTIRVINMRNTPTLTFDNETLFQVFIYVANGTTATFNNETFNLQLELGSTATSYVEHQEQTKTLHLGDIELAKIGTYQDRIYKNNDKWYKKEYIKKTNNVGSFADGGTGNVFYTTFITDYAISNNIPYSQYYKGVSNVNGASGMESQETNIIGFINQSGSTTPRFYIKDSRYTHTQVSQLNTWLANNPLTLYYLLATPNDIEITNTTLIEELNELEKMMSYNGQTNISISGNLPMLVSVSALKGE